MAFAWNSFKATQFILFFYFLVVKNQLKKNLKLP